jgi:hypothetical protein
LEKGIQGPDEHGLGHLKIALDAAFAIAALHYHLHIDELTNDL